MTLPTSARALLHRRLRLHLLRHGRARLRHPGLRHDGTQLVQMFPTEYDAFKKYAELYPDACVLLVDTYNVLRHGVPDAIKVFDEVLKPMGKRPKASASTPATSLPVQEGPQDA